MARIKNAASLDAEKKVTDAKVKYDSAVQELKVLIEERKELQMKELMREMEKSGKSFDEVIRLIRL
ncbi:MAG: hypothetical protein ACI4NM_04415 [Bullifex sp.]